jgi:hypothetical protein
MHSKYEVAVRYLGAIPGSCLEQLKGTRIKKIQPKLAVFGSVSELGPPRNET